MKIRIPIALFDYFKSERKLAISVNKIAEYLSLEEIKKINFAINFTNSELKEIDIDEQELDNNLLKNENLFVIVALYAMSVGE